MGFCFHSRHVTAGVLGVNRIVRESGNQADVAVLEVCQGLLQEQGLRVFLRLLLGDFRACLLRWVLGALPAALLGHLRLGFLGLCPAVSLRKLQRRCRWLRQAELLRQRHRQLLGVFRNRLLARLLRNLPGYNLA
jgi:hypothetical protein